MDLGDYRTEAEAFCAEHTLAYYRHYAGLDEAFDIDVVYERHSGLFERAAVEALRERYDGSTHGTESSHQLRLLLGFAVEGRLGAATRELEAEIAQREAKLQLQVDGEILGFRESSVAQANEADPERRERIEAARLAATAERINPLAKEMLETHHQLACELGWESYRSMCEQLQSIDLGALHAQTQAVTEATEDAYDATVAPSFRASTGRSLAEATRADLPRFFRAAEHDALFPKDRLVGSLTASLHGLGIDPEALPNVVLDVDSRPGKSPRAFCAPVRVPGEVYLVVPPMGGRDDYFALMHEAGHAYHYGHVDPSLPFEFRLLGDNSVTEGFAFLFDHLTEDTEWCRRRLGIEVSDELAAHTKAQEMVFCRRYAAKLAYELELHGADPPSDDALAAAYAEKLGSAVRLPWPRETFLTDVDPLFYAACYLRAWALETHLRAALQTQYGPAWFDDPEAGAWLRELWSEGQRLDAVALLAEFSDEELDFSVMLATIA